jgi:hypothetical protein
LARCPRFEVLAMNWEGFGAPKPMFQMAERFVGAGERREMP